jgi:hypothetical protein
LIFRTCLCSERGLAAPAHYLFRTWTDPWYFWGQVGFQSSACFEPRVICLNGSFAGRKQPGGRHHLRAGLAAGLGGFFLLAFPAAFMSVASVVEGHGGRALYAVLGLAGLYLAWVGWRPEKPRRPRDQRTGEA